MSIPDYKVTKNYAKALGVAVPERWLLDYLKHVVTAEAYAEIVARFKQTKQHYQRCSKLNKYARYLRDEERGFRRNMDATKWRAILADPAAYVFSEEKE